MDIKNIKTLGQLKKAQYQSKSIKEELRTNLIEKLKKGKKSFDGVHGFDHTVLPDIERALLSKHNILLLGLRGQAKTRIARQMVNLLDEYIPIVEGSEMNDDPLNPLSFQGKKIIENNGNQTPIAWLHRSDRFVEKLATPDVNVADLIGDIDPIKAASLKLSYSDEQVIHYGLIPRSHRSIFIINELPDLQARIQVALFNILQEGDIQIRGFKKRLPLDIMFVFTANPEDYTNRGSIITPLKDRISSQILTHYPQDIEIAKLITEQESRIHPNIKSKVHVPDIHRTLVENIANIARHSEFIDQKSGVSARLTISVYENLISTAERRMLINNEKETTTRITDFWGVIPSITGKIELVYEGEQEGSYNVAFQIVKEAITNVFLDRFPEPTDDVDNDGRDPYDILRAYFGDNNQLVLENDMSNESYEKSLLNVSGLKRLVSSIEHPIAEIFCFMELAIQGLAGYNVLSRQVGQNFNTFGSEFSDLFDDDLGSDSHPFK